MDAVTVFFGLPQAVDAGYEFHQENGTTEASVEITAVKDELIWGADAIAAEIGRDPRQVYNLLSTGSLPPARKCGGKWVVSRRRLWAWFEGNDGVA